MEFTFHPFRYARRPTSAAATAERKKRAKMVNDLDSSVRETLENVGLRQWRLEEPNGKTHQPQYSSFCQS